MNPLTREFVEATRRAFDVNGYLVIEEALSTEEVRRINEELDAIDLPDRGTVLPLVDKGEALFDLADHPRAFPYALALIGGNVQLLSSNVTILPPGAGRGGWHEDGPGPWPYPSVDGKRPLLHLKFGYFLNDLPADDRGNLVVVPGSHHVPFPHGVDRAGLWELPGATPLTVRAGAAVLFHNGLWHATSPNHTENPRRVLYYTYCPAWHRTYDYLTPPPELLARLESLPPERKQLLRQLLGAVPDGGAPRYYFPNPEEFPALKLIER